jgi:primary-amine oxidase
MASISAPESLPKLSRLWMGRVWLVLCCFLSPILSAQTVPVVNPLDALSEAEIIATVELLKAQGKTNENTRFPLIDLKEPTKDDVLGSAGRVPTRREAFVVTYDHASNRTFEAVIDLKTKTIISWKEIPGVQPSFVEDDPKILEQTIRADSRWQEAMKKRGISDLENVVIIDWAGGFFGLPDEDGFRFERGASYYRGSSKDGSLRPIEGVIAYVNLNTGKVFKFVDTGVVPVPRIGAGLGAIYVDKPRARPKPLEIVQREGADFEISDGQVHWQNWRFHFALRPREGLVVDTVAYEDRGSLRSVLYRGSLSEMVVPYGDPNPGWFFRNAFDVGENNMGLYADSLEPLTDAPSNATFINAVLADDKGVPYEIPRAIALYERDGGLLWKHYDDKLKHNESRRARQLVLAWIATVGNYEYGFNWIFHQDGTLEMEVILSGFVETKALQLTGNLSSHTDEYSHLLTGNLSGVHHQHFFNFRLDMDLDGIPNSVIEQNVEPLAQSSANPYGNAFTMKETLLRNEGEAQRLINLASSRKWKIVNPSKPNASGEPVGYTLVAGENSLPFASPDSWIRKRAGFVNAHLWVTPYDPSQMHAAGFYVNQSKGGDGLPTWTQAMRSIEDRDIVLWYTMGITHIPRPEDWPVMPVHSASFKLIPNGFFAQNPGLDLPH